MRPVKEKTKSISVKTFSSSSPRPLKVKTGAVIQNATVKEFSALKDISGYNNESLAALVGISHRTIRNKSINNEKFDLAQTERLRKLHLLFIEGNDVFGNKQQFHTWLQKPAYGLDYSTPGELLQQPGGLDKVLNEINALKFGDTV